MRHHDASKLTQRWNAPPGSPPPAPLLVEDSLPDAENRIGTQASLRSAADPAVLVYATLRERVSLEFTAEITGFSNGASQFDGMAIGDSISFDESYVVRFGADSPGNA
ncbi:hypothetical protein CDO44_18985 [Pigmentiphaga sp. NML080357]|uniref:hypothetical protein n=1 Tax=Pigmentiphaga sp. NML080357 TaxID=2008675 RepID=UPI000B41FDF4|nr:hypothetical protein [Pigmentiphaga sp. NML080357]OVZ57189.1 hypothetical protein CDO44_18985 [Pigmentiphaga sp. NML080357]